MSTDADSQASLSPLALVIHSYVLEACPNIGPNDSDEIDRVINSRLSGEIDHTTAIHLSVRLIGTAHPIDKLEAILSVGDLPLSSNARPRIITFNSRLRKKNELWSEYEDMRLLLGIHKFGLRSWGSVARFVGNNRLKTQCCQRWSRGLNPRIKRTAWTPEEDEKLQGLVERFGRKSWTRIALQFGDRCDVQCRYRFHQLSKGNESKADSEKNGEESSQEEQPPEKTLKKPLPSIQSLIDQVRESRF
jgi:hypothetical protein